MKDRSAAMNNFTARQLNDSLRDPLRKEIRRVKEKCIHCPKCMSECAFLRQNGTPGFIAENYHPENRQWLTLGFECSLCGLCTAVCPEQLSPPDMFLEMRREAVDRGAAPFPAHKRIMAYENRGISKKYSWYSLPEGCDTVLFPGCTFAGTRMDTTIALYEHLKGIIPKLGIVLDCCCKPSRDLGRDDFFQAMFGELRDYLTDHGVKTVIAACPNCFEVFKSHGDSLNVTTVYEQLTLAETPGNDMTGPGMPDSGNGLENFAIHDPCVLRDEKTVHNAVRKLAADKGFQVKEMPHSREKTLCCGEGGTVGCLNSELSDKWGHQRIDEAGAHRLLTYCAGCAGSLNRKRPTDHILDAVFYPEDVKSGKRKVARAPLTYFNRIQLKRYLQKKHPAPVTRERPFFPEHAGAYTRLSGKSGKAKILILLILFSVIAGIRFSGITDHFDSEMLREAVSSLGVLTPMVFILLYTVAPALFLPGLPLTIAGGILFGPVWGVVYSITGATFGASLAFLISRYVARDWIAAKCSGPRWQHLDQSVAKNGWKIVALTRLVPLFPFNLLNYAFGLTPIRFLPYAVTSFICMLPACIAFIVFSSSLVNLLKGNISPAFLIGILLIILVSLIPVIVRKLKPGKTQHLELS